MAIHNSRIPGRWISPEAGPAPRLISSTLNSVWNLANPFLEWFGDLGLFAWEVLRASVRRPFEGRELLRPARRDRFKSLPLVALAGAAIGFVLAWKAAAAWSFRSQVHASAALVYSIIQKRALS